MWQTKYASAVPKNLGLGLNLRLCSEGYFLSGLPSKVSKMKKWADVADKICFSCTYKFVIGIEFSAVQ